MFYVIQKTNFATRECMAYVQGSPGRTNMWRQEKTYGWLGTTNNVDEFAHGEFDSLEKAERFIKKKWKTAQRRMKGESVFSIPWNDK